LEELELCVSLDFYITETSRHADYILPSPTFFERDDLTDFWVANAPRPWVQYTPAVIAPRGEARLEYDVYDEILERLGLPGPFGAKGADMVPRPRLMEVADTMLRAGVYGDKFGANPNGLSIERLRAEFPEGVRVAERADAAASWSRVGTEDGRVHLWGAETETELARLFKEWAQNRKEVLYLFGRRTLGSLNSWMHNVERLVRSQRPTLLMHPDDACYRQIVNGQTVRITSKAASLDVDVEVEVSDDVISGSVNYPHGWGHNGGWTRANKLPGVNINLLASSDPADWEQVSGNVHLDGIPVTVLPA
jgi:formate dehydrogenase